MKIRKKIFYSLIFLIPALNACIPLAGPYHRPNASSGVLISEMCGTFISPRDTIQFTPEPLDIRISGSDTWISISLRVPENAKVYFKSGEIQLSIGGRTEKYQIEAFHDDDRELKKKISIPMGEPIIGKTYQPSFGIDHPHIFKTSVKFRNAVGATYSIKLPEITINEKPFRFPEITFTEEIGVAAIPLNC
jgi:hypothetical protein